MAAGPLRWHRARRATRPAAPWPWTVGKARRRLSPTVSTGASGLGENSPVWFEAKNVGQFAKAAKKTHQAPCSARPVLPGREESVGGQEATPVGLSCLHISCWVSLSLAIHLFPARFVSIPHGTTVHRSVPHVPPKQRQFWVEELKRRWGPSAVQT